jgi:hypothetical protein
METSLSKKAYRNARSMNPKKNPARRRARAFDVPTIKIGHWALKPKRHAMGRPIEGRFVRAWGGRKPSKYDPVAEDVKHEKAKKLAA